MNTNAPVSHFDSLKQIGYYFSYSDDTGKEHVYHIEPGNMADLQINWDSTELYVEGYCLFNDYLKITELLPPLVNIYFKISARDFTSVGDKSITSNYEEEFIITRMERQLSDNKNLTVKLTFIDKVYYHLGNTYISKGYNNVRSTDTIKDIITDKKLFPKPLTKKIINIHDSAIVYPNLVIPQNSSVISFIKSKELRDGFSFIHSRQAITTISHKDLHTHLADLYQDGNGIKFTYDNVSDEMNPFKVKTIKFLTTDNLLFNAVLPDCVSNVFNQGDMSLRDALVLDVGTLSNTIGDTSTLVNMNATTGLKRVESTSHDSVNRLYKFKLLETQLIEITVSGMFFYELFWKVGVELKSTIEGFNGKMPYVNGPYHILKIIDKYNGTNFNQVITLGRVGIENVFKS